MSFASSITDDLDDPYSMGVIGHEVAHALAGGGSRATLLDRDGDPGEHAADHAGTAFGHFAEGQMAGPVPKLAPAHGGQATIHRHEIEGPWNTNSPVHESITTEALKKAGVLGKDAKYTDPEAWEYTRGVMFNDDPTNQLFDDKPNGRTNDYSSGISWLSEFKSAEKEAAGGKKFGVGDSLLKRSHFGDLQALHGMAGEDGEDPAVTKQKMMMWAEFTTKVASGGIKGDAKMDELLLANPQFKALLGDDPTLKGVDVNKFFGIQGKGADLKARATGSLLHMIEDSYAAGHVEREDLGDGRMGKIKNFHSYSNQDHSKHGESDKVPDGPGTLSERAHEMPGGQDAIDQGAAVIEMLQEGKKPEEILAYLETNTFATHEDIQPANSGENYEKDPHDAPWYEKLGDYVGEKTHAVGDYMSEKGAAAKDWTVEKGTAAKDWTADTATDVKDWAVENGTAAKDWTVETANDAGEYASEKAGAAKNWGSKKLDEAGDAATGLWDWMAG